MRKFNIITRQSYDVPRDNPVIILHQAQPTDIFLVEKRTVGSKRLNAYFCTSDIRIFFNQQRLSQLSPTVLSNMLSMARTSSLSDGLTDAQLVDGLKSRYIQSQADVYNYTRYLQESIDSEVSRIKESIEAANEPPAPDVVTE